MFGSLVAVAVLCAMPACTMAPAASSPATAGATAPPTVPSLANTTVDEQAIRFGFEALDTTRSVVDALRVSGAIKAGSPKALAIADALERTRGWLNKASTLQRTGQAAGQAWNQAQAGLASVRAALAQK
jgi:hypothetical protein